MIIKFYEFMSEAVVDVPKGIYVKAAPVLQSAVLLKDRFPEMTVDDPHVTLLYSKESAHNVVLPRIGKEERVKAEGYMIERFDGQEKEGYVVLRVRGAGLQAWHDSFRNAGLVPTFPEYKPHVTLVTPAAKSDWERWIHEQNYILASRPLPLTFYYDGYSLLD